MRGIYIYSIYLYINWSKICFNLGGIVSIVASLVVVERGKYGNLKGVVCCYGDIGLLLCGVL